MFKSLSIRAKTILGVALLEGIALCVLIIGMVNIVGDTNTERFEEQAESTARLLATSVANAVVVYDLAEIESFVNQAAALDNVVYARVYDKQRRLLGESTRQASDANTLSDQVEITVPVVLSGIPFGEVNVGLNVSEAKAAASSAAKFGAGLGLVELIIVACFSFLLGSWLTRRLRILMNAASQIANGNLKQPISTQGQDEIAQVAIAMDLMRESLLKSQQENEDHRATLETTVKERTQDLEQANNVLKEKSDAESQMFATIGHEIRTPLSIAAMALKEQPNKAGWALVETNISHALDLANDMNVISRLDRGLGLVGLDVGSPCPLLDDIGRSASLLAKSLGMSFQFNLHCNEQVEVIFPTVAIRQVVYNLIKNACLHSGGQNIRLDMSTESTGGDKVRLSFSVSDDGLGIPESEHETMFKRFQRGSSTAEGMGIGLSVSQDIANSLNGTLKYSHAQAFEKGACFTLTVEVDRQKKGSHTTQSSEPNALNGISILLAEDNASIRLLTTKILEKAGASVDPAEDGQIAFDKLKQRSYDLVITDIMMPNMDGYELVEAARSAGFDGAIIGISAATLGEEFDRLREKGVKHVLSKPINIKEVNKALHQELTTKRMGEQQ